MLGVLPFGCADSGNTATVPISTPLDAGYRVVPTWIPEHLQALPVKPLCIRVHNEGEFLELHNAGTAIARAASVYLVARGEWSAGTIRHHNGREIRLAMTTRGPTVVWQGDNGVDAVVVYRSLSEDDAVEFVSKLQFVTIAEFDKHFENDDHDRARPVVQGRSIGMPPPRTH